MTPTHFLCGNVVFTRSGSNAITDYFIEFDGVCHLQFLSQPTRDAKQQDFSGFMFGNELRSEDARQDGSKTAQLNLASDIRDSLMESVGQEIQFHSSRNKQ